MGDTAALKTLPPELIKEVILALYLSHDQHLRKDLVVISAFNSAMQTCRAMRMICSGFITKLVVKDLGALERFPRHAVVKSLDLRIYSAIDAQRWLMNTHAVARGRLQHVETVHVQVRTLKVRHDK